MTEIEKMLTGDFTILDLGSAGGYDFPQFVRKMVTIIELDAVEKSNRKEGEYFKKVPLNTVIAGREGKRKFYVRKKTATSSLLKVNRNIVSDYGQLNYFKEVKTIEVKCITLKTLLQSLNIPRIDFI